MKNGGELINASYCGCGIVHGRGNRPQTDVDDLHDAKLNVLLQGALSARDQRSKAAATRRSAVILSPRVKCISGGAFRDEVADPTLDANGHAVHLWPGPQTFDVDESNVAGESNS